MLAALIFSLTPWTGPSLPTAVPNAHHYLVTLKDRPGQRVVLHAEGTPQGWIASFCTPRLCSPSRFQLQLDARGNGSVEFQVVRVDRSAASSAHLTLRADGIAVHRSLFLRDSVTNR